MPLDSWTRVIRLNGRPQWICNCGWFDVALTWLWARFAGLYVTACGWRLRRACETWFGKSTTLDLINWLATQSFKTICIWQLGIWCSFPQGQSQRSSLYYSWCFTLWEFPNAWPDLYFLFHNYFCVYLSCFLSASGIHARINLQQDPFDSVHVGAWNRLNSTQ